MRGSGSSNDALRSYVNDHTSLLGRIAASRLGYVPRRIPGEVPIPMVFVSVAFTFSPEGNLPNRAELLDRIQAHRGVRLLLNPRDGKQHTCHEIAEWVGEAELALRLMALGHRLGLWACITPYTLNPNCSAEVALQLAQAGHIAILTSLTATDRLPRLPGDPVSRRRRTQ